ncbi:Alpha/Beta hydrolase protein [Crassisporium funariophilum]|nr:Alpha/Beta hydrolase protein [Crassisporium funariophilum]
MSTACCNEDETPETLVCFQHRRILNPPEDAAACALPVQSLLSIHTAKTLGCASDHVRYWQNGDISWRDLAHLTTVVLRIPFVALWTYASNLALVRRLEVAKRATTVAAIRYINAKLNIAQIQYISGRSLDVYTRWTKANKLLVTVEDLIDDTVLVWIGPKRTDRVVLYFHGGAFLASVQDYSLSFWRHAQLELAKSDCDVGFAVLLHSLVPTAGLPTLLRQASVALEHVIASGVHPSNLHIVGDSAGALLALALLSHIMHPFPNVRKTIALKAPIRGVYLMSPWVCLNSTSASLHSPTDMIVGAGVETFGDFIRAHCPEDLIKYLEPLNAPDSWFIGLDAVVDRMLMTAGGSEIFRDDIIRFSQTLSKTKSNFNFAVQEGGVHDGPFIDLLTGQSPDQSRSFTELIIHWLAVGISPLG